MVNIRALKMRGEDSARVFNAGDYVRLTRPDVARLSEKVRGVLALLQSA